MTIRADNLDPAIDTILSAISSVAIANTQFQSDQGSVHINDDSALVTDQGPWPALLLMDNGYSEERIDWRTWKPQLIVLFVYMNLYDDRSDTLDAIWQEINVDIRRMKANLTDNPRLALPTVPLVETIKRLDLSPFTNKAVERERYGTVPVVQRYITITLALLPYVSAS